MKELFDRHADRITEAEDRRLWAATHDAIRGRRASGRRWGVGAALTAGLAAAVVVVVVIQRSPEPSGGEFALAPERNAVTSEAPAPAAVQLEQSADGDLGRVNARDDAPAENVQEQQATGDATGATAPGFAAAPAPVARVEAKVGAGSIRGRVTNSHGEPLAFAGVAIEGTNWAAFTDTAGVFLIDHLPPGGYTLNVSYLGYEKVERTVRLVEGGDLAQDFAMNEVLVAELDVLQSEYRREKVDGGELATTRGKDENTKSLRDRLSQVIGKAKEEMGSIAPGMTAPAPEPASNAAQDGRTRSVSGSGASGQVLGLGSATAPMTPAARDNDYPNSVGGTDPVNGQAFDAMFFKHYGVNPFIDPQDDNQSTFAVDVDNASYTLARSYLERGELPPDEAIRVEEFVNSFNHRYRAPRASLVADRRGGPSEHGTFAIYMDAAPSPFGKGLTLLRVGLKGKEIDPENRKPAVLTFVVDVSGSMEREDRLELVKKALFLLLDQTRPDDQVGLVVYGSDARVVLAHTSARQRETIESAIASLRPEGATNAEAGLREAYALADRGYRKDAINRVILCSDGVANVGETGADGILAVIKQEARRGIYLTAAGFGMGNYNDVLMEQLANHADGNYYYVDDLPEAKRVFVENLTGTLQTIARQVKIQVEFDEDKVRRYRLVGYENRDVADRDFRNDAVDAGEVGAGHEVTGLFELKLEKGARGNLATVRIRYEDPETGNVSEEERSIRVEDLASRIEDADPTFQMDAAVAEFSEILRHSYWAKDGDLAPVVGLARSASRELGRPEDLEGMVQLAETAWRLLPRGEESEWRDGPRPQWEPEEDRK